jgi:ferredoxin
MRVEVDWTRCAGHGVCAAALSELITRDPWGFPIVLGEVPPDLKAAARTAAATCPALALRLRR